MICIKRFRVQKISCYESIIFPKFVIADDNRCALGGWAADACSDMLASFYAAKIMRSQAKENLGLQSNALTESIFRWEDINVRLLQSISQEPSTISRNASKPLSLLVGINPSYSHI
ncbi:hypothetical protein D0A34_02725 [Microcoleus vaginatus PCC 9802]|uniref:hypothetical protein n=1 Tax=Microcoleus vaginatus TaxID=119532 RepID=UPI000587A5B8|nr:hypothetical protein D0A34_02725 [Microcoleus vaginatus PCC 9802]